MSSEDIKAAEEWANIFWDESDLEESERSEASAISLAKSSGVCGFLAGVAHARKELEQVAREAFEAARYGKYTRNSIMPRPLLWSEVQHDFDYKEFEDYWAQKTESKEEE